MWPTRWSSTCPPAAAARKELRSLKEAVRLFLDEAERMGTLEQILTEAAYSRTKRKIAGPKFLGVQSVSLAMPPAHAEA